VETVANFPSIKVYRCQMCRTAFTIVPPVDTAS
jgi:hypothetical protein